jgi:F-type H+-transporting ATPase subunit delta
MDTLVAKKYAKALLELEGISLEDVLEQLKAVSEVINSNSEVKEFLNSPLVSSSKKFEAVVEPIADKLDKKVVALLTIMANKGRLALIPELTELLNKEIMFKNNKFEGVVESADEIDGDLIKKLEQKLSKYSNSEIKLEVKKSDIDGIKAEVKDLGLELNFSKASVKKALIEHIQKAL